jgi:PhnB protein
MAVRPIPEGYHSVTPYLVVPGVARLIEFLKQAFAAIETERMAGPDGTVMHAEVQIGDSRVMMGEAHGEYHPMPAVLQLYVEDVDAVYERAVRAGGTSLEPPTDQFYGDRRGGVRDPSGNQWWIGTRKEDLSTDELARRAKVALQQRAQQ